MRTTDLQGGRLLQVGIGYPVGREGQSSLPFGLNAQAVRYRKVNLTTARTRLKIPVVGNVLAVTGSSAPLAHSFLSFSERDKERIPVREGLVLRGVAFRELYLSHVAQPDQYLGLLTLVDPGAAFDLVTPPPIDWAAAAASGFAFGGRTGVGAVAGENGMVAFLNETTDWVSVLTYLATGGDGSVHFQADRTNTELNATLSAMAASQSESAFGNYDGTTTAGKRARQTTILQGTDPVVDTAIRANPPAISTQVEGTAHGSLIRPITILPGFNFVAVDSSQNAQLNVGFGLYEIPFELWSGRRP